ncbi:MAG: AzlD domain-containing protein [Lachnospiraceae bacterium]|nr:AzlD domain-containing protein [Lachnospiraceae bacterium]
MHDGLLIVTMAVVTAFLRFLPFLIWNGKRKTPAYILFLGKYLPYSIMGMLVVYCLKGVQILTFPHGLPELLAVVAVILLHVWKKNTLLSIIGGTALYMILIQMVFI